MVTIFRILLAAVFFTSLVPAAAAAKDTDNLVKNLNTLADCSTLSLCQTDNSELSAFMESSTPFSRRFLISQALSDFNNSTNLTVQFPASPTYTGGSETDVVYRVSPAAVPVSDAAITLCDDPIDDLRCDQQYVNFGANEFVTLSRSCHETGHAVGLTHGVDADPRLNNLDPRLGCMITPTESGVQPNLGYNSVDNINENYSKP